MRAVVPLGLAAVLASCGYAFSSGAARFPPGAERIFVRPFENRTTDAELGALVAAAVRQELARRDADGASGARARIEGTVEGSSFGLSVSSGGTSSITLDASARLLVDGKVVAERRARRTEEYLAGMDPLENEGRRRLALRRASESVARDLVEQLERP
jgi:hypothetical protein